MDTPALVCPACGNPNIKVKEDKFTCDLCGFEQVGLVHFLAELLSEVGYQRDGIGLTADLTLENCSIIATSDRKKIIISSHERLYNNLAKKTVEILQTHHLDKHYQIIFQELSATKNLGCPFCHKKTYVLKGGEVVCSCGIYHVGVFTAISSLLLPLEYISLNPADDSLTYKRIYAEEPFLKISVYSPAGQTIITIRPIGAGSHKHAAQAGTILTQAFPHNQIIMGKK